MELLRAHPMYDERAPDGREHDAREPEGREHDGHDDAGRNYSSLNS